MHKILSLYLQIQCNNVVYTGFLLVSKDVMNEFLICITTEILRNFIFCDALDNLNAHSAKLFEQNVSEKTNVVQENLNLLSKS